MIKKLDSNLIWYVSNGVKGDSIPAGLDTSTGTNSYFAYIVSGTSKLKNGNKTICDFNLNHYYVLDTVYSDEEYTKTLSPKAKVSSETFEYVCIYSNGSSDLSSDYEYQVIENPSDLTIKSDQSIGVINGSIDATINSKVYKIEQYGIVRSKDEEYTINGNNAVVCVVTSI